jgi:SWI/SNF-related matrix-associated actin-dependent regulator of chromatin subfamily A member 5
LLVLDTLCTSLTLKLYATVDRAHRIGQKKPVQVFRFITEGTVEEKIIERADRKLFLDAAVIQQGRLAEQHSSLDKDDLMKMVRFGADQILSKTGGTYTDEDIDALIAKGEEKTSEINAKLNTDAKHDLSNFSLIADDDGGRDTFAFGGKNYRDADKNVGNFINLPQRQRKRNYDVNEYYRETMNAGASSGMKAHAADAASKKRKKGPALHDFQLFDRERLNTIAEQERTLAEKKEDQLRVISVLRSRAQQAASSGLVGAAPGQSKEEMMKTADAMEKRLDDFKLSDEDQAEKVKLQAEGFPDWSRKDFKSFTSSLESHGRYDFKSLSRDMINETGKDIKEIQRYFVAFWTNFRRLHDWKKITDKIERGERKILRLRQIRDVIQEKIERHLEDVFGPQFAEAKDGAVPSSNELLEYSWSKMKIQYGASSRGRAYQEEEDAFLVCMMHRHGYGAAERIRMEIRRAWQFRFDWYFKSRSAQEIQKRCDAIVKFVEKENEEFKKIEEGEAERKKAAASEASPGNAQAPSLVEQVETAPAATGVVGSSGPTNMEE